MNKQELVDKIDLPNKIWRFKYESQYCGVPNRVRHKRLQAAALELYHLIRVWIRFDSRDVHDPITIVQGRCALAIDTPIPMVVHDLVEHGQPNP